jgi:hypothetical protein
MLVAYTCNPSYSGSRDQEEASPRQIGLEKTLPKKELVE